MPRNGAGVYSHPFPNVVEGTTIESAVFNGNTSDVEQDLNTPRPIVAGGTGANNAHDAMIALSGEIAQQGPVTNYDSFPFVPGSFYSLAGATAAPNPTNRFVGTCVAINDGTGDLRLDISNVGGTLSYYRVKLTGVWGGWVQKAGSTADLDAAYVNVTGDIMTGGLALRVPANAGLQVGSADGTTLRGLFFNTSDNQISLGTQSNHPLSFLTNDTPRAAILANGAANFYSTIASTSPTTGALTVAGGVGINGNSYIGGNLTITGTSTPQLLWQGTSGSTKLGQIYLQSDVLNFAAAGFAPIAGFALNGDPNASWLRINSTLASTSPTAGALTVAGGVGVGGKLYVGADIYSGADLYAGYASVAGTVRFGSGATKYLTHDGNNFVFSGGNLYTNGAYFSQQTPAAGAYYFGAAANNKYINFDGTYFNIFGGQLNTTNLISSQGGYHTTAANYGLTVVGFVNSNPLFYTYMTTCDPNIGVAYRLIGVHNSGVWAGMQVELGGVTFQFRNTGVAYNAAGGPWVSTSDARIKNVIGNYTSGLDAIAALRPVRYTYKGNETTSPPANHSDTASEEEKAKASKNVPTVPYPNSIHYDMATRGVERIGLIAQQAAETMPELVTTTNGYIDGVAVDDLHDLDTGPLIFALINAVKELKAEVDALKAAR